MGANSFHESEMALGKSFDTAEVRHERGIWASNAAGDCTYRESRCAEDRQRAHGGIVRLRA